MVDLPFRVDFCMVKLAIPSRSSGSSCWVETKFPEGVEYGGIVSLVIRKLSVRLKHMRMTANDHINTLLHQKSSPLFFVFIWHGFIFSSPVSHKDDAVADFFGFLDHCGDLILIKDIDHVLISFACTGIIGAVCIVKKSNLNTIHFFYFDSVCIFLGGVDAKYRNIRIIGAPEIQSTFQIVISIIIGVICGRSTTSNPALIMASPTSWGVAKEG